MTNQELNQEAVNAIRESIKYAIEFCGLSKDFKLSQIAFDRLYKKTNASIYENFGEAFSEILPFLVGYDLGVNEK